MASLPFDFQGSRGYRLAGRLEQPAGAVRGWALLAHCFTCGKDHVAASRVARTLASRGIGVLRFDFAGLGASGGTFADATFAADVADLAAAGAAMAAAGRVATLLVGHSLGGAAALAAAGSMPQIRAVATIAAPFDAAHVLGLIDAAALQRIEAQGEAEVLLAQRPFVVRRSFVQDLRRHDQGPSIASLRRALLVMHAPGDSTVDIDNANRIFMAARHPKSFVSLDDADHLLSRRADAEYAAGVIAAWASRYLDDAHED